MFAKPSRKHLMSINEKRPETRTKKRLSAALAALGTTIILSGGVAQAMPAGYCDSYTRSAIREFHSGLASRACVAQMSELPIRWHDNYAIHFNWCLAQSYGSTISERNARLDLLRSCR
jgi:hypothetical protein